MSCDVVDETIPINKNYPGKYKNFLEDKYNFVDACQEKVGTTDFDHINENLDGTYSFKHLFDVADNLDEHYDDCCPFEKNAGPWPNFHSLARDRGFEYACRGVICHDEDLKVDHGNVHVTKPGAFFIAPLKSIRECLDSCHFSKDSTNKNCIGVGWDEPVCTGGECKVYAEERPERELEDPYGKCPPEFTPAQRLAYSYPSDTCYDEDNTYDEDGNVIYQRNYDAYTGPFGFNFPTDSQDDVRVFIEASGGYGREIPQRFNNVTLWTIENYNKTTGGDVMLDSRGYTNDGLGICNYKSQESFENGACRLGGRVRIYKTGDLGACFHFHAGGKCEGGENHGNTCNPYGGKCSHDMKTDCATDDNCAGDAKCFEVGTDTPFVAGSYNPCGDNGTCILRDSWDARKISFEPSTTHIFFNKSTGLEQTERSHTYEEFKDQWPVQEATTKNNNSKLPRDGNRDRSGENLYYQRCENPYAPYSGEIHEKNICYSYPQAYERLDDD